MTTILIVESNPPDYPQDAPLFQTALAQIAPGAVTRVARPFAAPVSPDMLDGADGVIFTGSAVAWRVDTPMGAPLWAAMEQVFANGLPTYGSCNGMQLAACVLGGVSAVSRNGQERGLARGVTLTGAGLTHPFLAGRRQGYSVPCIHNDEVTALPTGSVLLAGNAHSPVQAFVYDQNGVRFWGVQYHPEVPPAHMAEVLIRAGETDAVMIADLRIAETDAGAARRLGATPDDLAPTTRLTELRNWVEHIRAYSTFGKT
jgi:GMP synthase (glutamine-hydrolysing)